LLYIFPRICDLLITVLQCVVKSLTVERNYNINMKLYINIYKTSILTVINKYSSFMYHSIFVIQVWHGTVVLERHLKLYPGNGDRLVALWGLKQVKYISL